MRAPDDLPRRPRRASTGHRRRTVLIVAVVAVFILLLSLRGIAGFYTDYLWFDSLGQGGVWRGVLGAKVLLAVAFMGVFFVLAWANLFVADRMAPPYRVSGPEDELLERYHDVVGERAGWVRVGVAGLLALIAGSGVSAEWNSWLLFAHGRDFGVRDAQFGRDVGFYVFKLPFLSFVVDWLFASLLIVLIVTAVAHYLNGGIRVQPPGPRVTSQVKAHLSVLLAVLAVVKAVDYWLQRFELTASTRGTVDGLTYTDGNAQLPALNLLVLISIAAAVLFVVNIFRRGWVLPTVAMGLWAFVAVVVGGIYPAVVQRYQVKPNEFAREEPYIERNIAATRDAMNIEGVEVRKYAPRTRAADVSLANARQTVRNIRLWDPAEIRQTFERLQGGLDYYAVDDIDVDRYQIDGETTQVNIAVRTIDSARVPGESWENRHLAYTHGYGVLLAPSNAVTRREPKFDIGDIPARVDADGMALRQPDIYFGEGLDGYVMVNTARAEIDYQDGEATRTTEYRGKDGVAANSLLRRAAFALRFGDLNPVISDYLTDDSRVIYNRDVVDRVEALAPFLSADHDPYPVVLPDGRVTWVVDLYTTTDRYPYAQRADTDELPSGSGLRHEFNYVRNSVKATVDAYDGTVHFYVVDEDDPIVQAYRDAFPDLFSDRSEMPDGLADHLRYPEDLFRVQTATYGRYHVTDPEAFYRQPDTWRVPRDPKDSRTGQGAQTPGDQGETGDSAARIAPYYQVLQLPPAEGEEPTDAEMVLMRPFVPFSEADERPQLTAFMAARMDPDHYGELVAYELEGDNLPAGPVQVAANIRSSEEVRALENQRGDVGSDVRYGNLLLVPVDDAILYVQPFYAVADSEAGGLPLLDQVIVSFGNDVVVDDTLRGALQRLFDERADTQENPDAPPSGSESPGDGEAPSRTASTSERAAELLADAERLYAQAQEALRSGDFATYGDRIERYHELVAQAANLLNGESSGSSSSSDSPSSGSPDGAQGGSTSDGSSSSSSGGTTTTTTAERSADSPGTTPA